MYTEQFKNVFAPFIYGRSQDLQTTEPQHNGSGIDNSKPKQPTFDTDRNSTLVIVDGLNLIYGGVHQKPSMRSVMALSFELLRRGVPFKVFFDASTFATLMRADKRWEAYLYRRLCYDFPTQFVEVPARSRADDFLLQFADASQSRVISNDLFRDFATRFPWVSDDTRRIAFLAHSGLVQITALKVIAVLPDDLRVAESNLRSLMGTAGS